LKGRVYLGVDKVSFPGGKGVFSKADLGIIQPKLVSSCLWVVNDLWFHPSNLLARLPLAFNGFEAKDAVGLKCRSPQGLNFQQIAQIYVFTKSS
jgi:hypothetical protein